jgi:hypothetical protein
MTKKHLQVIPCIDTFRKVDLRVLSFDVPPQEVGEKHGKIIP